MPGISLIPTSRVSDAFVARRLMEQMRSEQLALYRLQNSIASGHRFSVPSDNAPAALRTISLQTLLERKAQTLGNLTTNQGYLGATESALSGVGSLLAEIRGSSIEAIDGTIDQHQREVIAGEVSRALEQLIDLGNQQFRGRSLFAGSQTQIQPFARQGNVVEFLGNSKSLMSYSDIDALFSSNVSGTDAFGAISDSVTGAVDLTPALTGSTKLSDLRSGLGIRKGSVAVSNGATTSIIDLSSAATIDDVARLLETQPPAGSRVTARITSSGLVVSLDAGTLSINEVGNGTVASELGIRLPSGSGPGPIVGSDLNPRLTLSSRVDDVLGTRAIGYVPNSGGKNDLIFEAAVAGTQLNGVTIKYIDDDVLQAADGLIAGNEVADFHIAPVAAVASLTFNQTTGFPNNDILLTATTAGTALNGVAVEFDVRAADAGGIQINYNSGTKTYSISVEDGVHNAAQVAAAIAAHGGGGGPFTAALDTTLDGGNNGSYVFNTTDSSLTAANTFNTGSDANTLAIRIDRSSSTANQVIAAVMAQGAFRARVDRSEPGNDGTGTLVDSATDASSVAITAGGSGEVLDKQSGIRITNGGVTYTVDLSTAATIEDVLNRINGVGAGVLAEINANGTGINVRSRLSGADFSIGENGGTSATQLGIRSLTSSTTLSELNHGQGVVKAATADFRITRSDGVQIDVNLTQGISASARLSGAGADSALLISRASPGAEGNAFSVQITDSGPGGGDAVSLQGNVLKFHVDVAAGFTAQEAITLLDGHPTLGQQFKAQLDLSGNPLNTGSGNLSATVAIGLSGGKGSAVTIGDVLDLINNDPANLAAGVAVEARLATFGNGIELVDEGPPSGGTLTVTALGAAQAARHLGLVSATSSTAQPATPGVAASTSYTLAGANNDLIISAAGSGTLLNGATVQFVNDGVAGNNNVSYDAANRVLSIDVDPATTSAQDVIDLIDAHPLASLYFTAALSPLDGGLPNTGLGTLGALPADQQLAGGTADVITGGDPNPIEVRGAFTALIRLRDAILANDSTAISRAVSLLDEATVNLNFARAELGTQLRTLDTLQVRLEDEEVQLKTVLSAEFDVDLIEAITELTTRQSAFEAALATAGAISKLTLLDFL